MNTFSHKDELFTASGCLSPKALEKYSGQQLSAEERKLVQKHLATCPLCKDAVEGAAQIPDIALHSSHINDRLRSRFRYIPVRRKRKGPALSNFFIPAAASVVVLVSIIAWFHYLYPEKQELAVLNEDIPEQFEGKETEAVSTWAAPVIEKEEAATVGGVFSRDQDNTEVTSRVETEADVEEDVVTDPPVEIARLDDLTEEETDMEKALPEESEVADKTIEVYALEEKAGAGESGVPVMHAKRNASESRQKESADMAFTEVEQQPKYPGGADSLQSFLDKNLLYPDGTDFKKDIVVLASFVVSKKGKIKDITIARSGGKAFDDEVIRIIKLMPEWIPATLQGKAIAVKYNLPIRFNSE